MPGRLNAYEGNFLTEAALYRSEIDAADANILDFKDAINLVYRTDETTSTFDTHIGYNHFLCVFVDNDDQSNVWEIEVWIYNSASKLWYKYVSHNDTGNGVFTVTGLPAAFIKLRVKSMTAGTVSLFEQHSA